MDLERLGHEVYPEHDDSAPDSQGSHRRPSLTPLICSLHLRALSTLPPPAPADQCRMPYRLNYPQSLAEVLDPPLAFRRETVMAVRGFARRRPWRGSLEERRAKFARLHHDLCSIYGKQTTLR